MIEAPSRPLVSPRGLVGRVMNRSDAPALPVPQRENIHAFVDQKLMERWSNEAAGVRAVEKGDNVITIFGYIGEDFWSEGITAKSIARQLRAISGPVEVQINSPGGDVFEGFAIYNLLREHPYDVTVKVIGMAASAASVIAMAGNTVQIGAAAFIMIHNCWVLGIGNRHDLRELADFLEPFDQALADVYVARSAQSEADVKKWLDAETYMSGALAIERGFADELLPSDQVTVDDSAQANDRQTNDVRALEQTLLASGMTRTQARERIKRVKGVTPGADTDPGEPGMHDAADWGAAAGGLLAELQKPLNI